jgi:hypothetical protein
MLTASATCEDFCARANIRAGALRRLAARLPEACPYTLAQLIDENWLPPSAA